MSVFISGQQLDASSMSGNLTLTGNLYLPSSYSTSIGSQPAFYAGGRTGWLYSNSFNGINAWGELGSSMAWQVTQQGAGSYGFSTSTGRYTAPVAGNYYFYGQSYYLNDSNSTANYIHFLLARNGNVTWNNGRTPYNIYSHGEKAGYSDGINVSAILNLGVGDYASIIPYWASGGSGRLYSDHTLFCGYLLG
jgi:hypothetical protein